MLLYGLLTIVIISFIFIKVKYRFWSSQPIFHIYDIRYWLVPPGIIQRGIPCKTKFYDDNITFHIIEKMKRIERSLLYGFIKMHILKGISLGYTLTLLSGVLINPKKFKVVWSVDHSIVR